MNEDKSFEEIFNFNADNMFEEIFEMVDDFDGVFNKEEFVELINKSLFSGDETDLELSCLRFMEKNPEKVAQRMLYIINNPDETNDNFARDAIEHQQTEGDEFFKNIESSLESIVNE